VCENCGWWFSELQIDDNSRTHSARNHCIGAGVLYSFAAIKEMMAIAECREALNPASAKTRISPVETEHLVASIFRAYGYSSHVTAFSGDGGIDVILYREREVFGVQVKRYKNSIEVDQIRSFAGAMILNDLTRGVFVTTSRFQRGCVDAAEMYKRRGIDIELVDGARLLEALDVPTYRQVNAYEDVLFEPFSQNMVRRSHAIHR
jgi:restriction endonuclease Mrr